MYSAINQLLLHVHLGSGSQPGLRCSTSPSLNLSDGDRVLRTMEFTCQSFKTVQSSLRLQQFSIRNVKCQMQTPQASHAW